MRTGRLRRRVGVLAPVVVAGALALAGCGVSTGGPAAIPRSQVPFNLLVKNPPATSTTLPNNQCVSVYYADTTGHLDPVPRFIPVHSHVQDAIEALLQPPSEGETNQGLVTYLGNVRLLDVQGPTPVQGGGSLVTVDLNSAFGEISGSFQVLAVGQLVLTISAFEKSTTQVQFEIEGNGVDVPTGNGTQALAPVTAWDYLALIPPGGAPIACPAAP